MRRTGQPPNLVQVLVLVLASMALTFEVREGAALEVPPTEKVSFSQPPTVAEREEFLVLSEPADSGTNTVHCPIVCLHAPAVRWRADHLWLLALLLAALSARPLSVVVRRGRTPDTRRAAAATGVVILLHLCICRC